MAGKQGDASEAPDLKAKRPSDTGVDNIDQGRVGTWALDQEDWSRALKEKDSKALTPIGTEDLLSRLKKPGSNENLPELSKSSDGNYAEKARPKLSPEELKDYKEQLKPHFDRIKALYDKTIFVHQTRAYNFPEQQKSFEHEMNKILPALRDVHGKTSQEEFQAFMDELNSPMEEHARKGGRSAEIPRITFSLGMQKGDASSALSLHIGPDHFLRTEGENKQKDNLPADERNRLENNDKYNEKNTKTLTERIRETADELLGSLDKRTDLNTQENAVVKLAVNAVLSGNMNDLTYFAAYTEQSANKAALADAFNEAMRQAGIEASVSAPQKGEVSLGFSRRVSDDEAEIATINSRGKVEAARRVLPPSDPMGQRSPKSDSQADPAAVIKGVVRKALMGK